MPANFDSQSTRNNTASSRRVLALLLLATTACRGSPPTPLAAAAAADDVARVQSLLAAGPAPGSLELEIALAWAARCGASRGARALLDAGAPIDGGDGRPAFGWTPLITAVHTGHWQTARDLLAWGANPNAAAPNGVTPLIMITGESDDEWHIRMVEDLLLAGADPHARTAEGATAFSNAMAGGNAHIVARLLAAAPDLRLEPGFTNAVVGVLATLRGDGALLDRARGVAPTDDAWPPFLVTVRDGTSAAALAALAAGADPLARAPDSRTSLMLAAARGDLPLVQALLAAGVDPRAEAADHLTALSHAVAGGSVDVVRAVLEAAPDLRLRTIPEDEGALFAARLQHADALLDLLRERGALP